MCSCGKSLHHRSLANPRRIAKHQPDPINNTRPSTHSPAIIGWPIRFEQFNPAFFGSYPPRVVGGENLGRGIHAFMFVEEGANIASKLPIVGLSGGVERIGGLFIGTAYLAPAERAGCNERRQVILAARDGDGLFVGATIGVRDPAAPFGSQPRP